MGKKGTKRKTTWRTLSIADSVEETSSQTNGSTEPNSEEASSRENRYINSSYLRRKSLLSSSSNIRNDSRGDYPRNYYKQNSTLSSSSSYSSRNSYNRRPFQSNTSRFFSYRTGRTQASRAYDANKENNQEEYTRITTPRQDVIFKKGYLSQPRKYMSSTDTNTTSSAAASIISTEESISAASVPSLSPEQCSSYADSVDPEQAFMCSYFDQNGIFYINPCLPNGFDQYSGQMFMLPYSYQPYNAYPSDLNSPMPSTDVEENPTSTDSKQNLSDKETNIKETIEDIKNNCDSTKLEISSESKETPLEAKNDKNDENPTTEKMEKDENEITKAPLQNYYNCGYPPYYPPPVFFPYVYGQQFVPILPEGDDYHEFDGCSEDETEEENNCKNEDGTVEMKSDENSNGAKEDCKTTPCDASIVEATEPIQPDAKIEEQSACNTETEKKIKFNANAEEFIPRLRQPHLNVNVKEFLPSNYQLTENPECSNDSEVKNSKMLSKDDDGGSVKTSLPEKVNPPEQKKVASVESQENPIKPIKDTKEEGKLTFAERIKKEMAKKIMKSSPPKNTCMNLVNKRNTKRNEKRISTEKATTSYAQMLTKDNQRITKTTANPTGVAVTVCSSEEKNPAKDTVKLHELPVDASQSEVVVQSKGHTEKSSSAEDDEWHTVKSKGKRKHFKENITVEVDGSPEKEQPIHPIQDTQSDVDCLPPTEQTQTSDNVLLKTPPPPTRQCEEESREDEITDNSSQAASTSCSEKKHRSRNKKQKKCSNATSKKTKEREVVKESGSKTNEKTEQKCKSSSKSTEAQRHQSSKVSRSLFMASESSEEDLTLDSLYLLDGKNYLLTKNFCRNPLELLNGFDCKIKGNNGILKEEEEMVLNVIKSLSTNQTRPQEIIKSPAQDASIGGNVSVDNSAQPTVNEIDPDRKITESSTDDCKDLSDDALDRDPEPQGLLGNSEIEPRMKSVNSTEIIAVEEEFHVNCKSDVSQEDCQSEERLDTTAVAAVEAEETNSASEQDCDVVPNDAIECNIVENSADINCEIASTATQNFCTASTLQDSNELNAYSPRENACSVQNDCDSIHLDLAIYKSRPTPEKENVSINEIFELKMKEIEEIFDRSSKELTGNPTQAICDLEVDLSEAVRVEEISLESENLNDVEGLCENILVDEEESEEEKKHPDCMSNEICSSSPQSDSLVVNLMGIEEPGDVDDSTSYLTPLSSARVSDGGEHIYKDYSSEHLDENSTSDYHSSNECNDSKNICNSKAVELIAATTTTPPTPLLALNEPRKYPLTMAVKQWLINEVKEKTPEPIFRLPDDPKLNSIITSSIVEQVERNREVCEDWTSDESDDENEKTMHSKNLQSNPSHVSSVNVLMNKDDRRNHQNDTDSDYNSDSPLRYDEDDNTCERVAITSSDTSSAIGLDYWDDEFIRDPKKWLQTKRASKSTDESESSEQFTPYESVYGKSIDYNRLLADNYEFLSNNIISFNGSNPDEDMSTSATKTNVRNDHAAQGFGMVGDSTCRRKPLEVCCIIM